MFRYKSKINISYARQGYIYFKSLMYPELPEKEREEIKRLCREYGGEYYEALMGFVTTNAGAEAICSRYYLSRSTLHRVVRRYYENFPIDL